MGIELNWLVFEVDGRRVSKISYDNGLFTLQFEPYGFGIGATLKDACEDFLERERKYTYTGLKT